MSPRPVRPEYGTVSASRGGRPARGFTLLELIVVVGIFAVFAAMAYGGLTTVLNARSQVEDRLARTEDYDRAYVRMRTDFENAVRRGIRDGTGQQLAAFTFDSYTHRVEFTRGGWQNLLSLPRSTLERVSYYLDDSLPEGQIGPRSLDDRRLVRRSWYVLDRAPQTKPVEVVLLDHVQDINWRFLDTGRAWQDTWGTDTNTSAFSTGTAVNTESSPLAVEMKMKTKDWGELKFLFALGAEGANQKTPVGGNRNGGSSGGGSGSGSGGPEGAGGGSGG